MKYQVPIITDPDAANERFRSEVKAFDLRYRCEDCDHFAPATATCSLHFETRWLTTPDLRMVNHDGRIVFCKYFELLG